MIRLPLLTGFPSKLLLASRANTAYSNGFTLCLSQRSCRISSCRRIVRRRVSSSRPRVLDGLFSRRREMTRRRDPPERRFNATCSVDKLHSMRYCNDWKRDCGGCRRPKLIAIARRRQLPASSPRRRIVAVRRRVPCSATPRVKALRMTWSAAASVLVQLASPLLDEMLSEAQHRRPFRVSVRRA